MAAIPYLGNQSRFTGFQSSTPPTWTDYGTAVLLVRPATHQATVNGNSEAYQEVYRALDFRQEVHNAIKRSTFPPAEDMDVPGVMEAVKRLEKTTETGFSRVEGRLASLEGRFDSLEGKTEDIRKLNSNYTRSSGTQTDLLEAVVFNSGDNPVKDLTLPPLKTANDLQGLSLQDLQRYAEGYGYLPNPEPSSRFREVVTAYENDEKVRKMAYIRNAIGMATL